MRAGMMSDYRIAHLEVDGVEGIHLSVSSSFSSTDMYRLGQVLDRILSEVAGRIRGGLQTPVAILILDARAEETSPELPYDEYAHVEVYEFDPDTEELRSASAGPP